MPVNCPVSLPGRMTGGLDRFGHSPASTRPDMGRASPPSCFLLLLHLLLLLLLLLPGVLAQIVSVARSGQGESHSLLFIEAKGWWLDPGGDCSLVSGDPGVCTQEVDCQGVLEGRWATVRGNMKQKPVHILYSSTVWWIFIIKMNSAMCLGVSLS